MEIKESAENKACWLEFLISQQFVEIMFVTFPPSFTPSDEQVQDCKELLVLSFSFGKNL